ncbi:F-box/FBD/LRR protein [Rhynchospora pubera]|uniref:F-box/FBD/LRR protein n=1 Tax=Rhynchospora pubera TaxID=906938 RepID=A0AAV8HDK1_9POAL|nr:F-box/FBD/LRR protein [Rhynchospora pubera]
MVMAPCSLPGLRGPDQDQPDLLSTLPDELLITILSFLSTCEAARTSILSSHFRHLWEASPSVHLTASSSDKFVTMIDRALIRRNSPHSLLSLHLMHRGDPLPASCAPSIIDKVSSLDLQHLTIDSYYLGPILPSISSITSLQSLSFRLVYESSIFPSGLTLTCLKSLFLELCSVYPVAELAQFLSELCSLEDLHLITHSAVTLSLSSKSIRKLRLINHGDYTSRLDTLELFLPLLESFNLELRWLLSSMFQIIGEFPLLKRAVIKIADEDHTEDVVTRTLTCISHAEELSLRVKERELISFNPSIAQLRALNQSTDSYFPNLYTPSLLAKARSLGLRHLIIDGLDITLIIPSIFSINSLQSLSLSFPVLKSNFIFPSGSKLTCLRRLYLNLCGINPIGELNRFISELCSLEDLHMETHANDTLSVSSKSIRKLKLIIFGDNFKLGTLGLFLPSLELLHLETPRLLSRVFHIDGEVPLLKRAVISLVDVHAVDANAVTKLLNFISHVEELSLRVKESWNEKHPVPILLKPTEDVSKFYNLKRLDVNLCILERSFEAVIIMLHYCPNLESLNLVYEILKFTGNARRRKRENRGSVLSSEYAYSRNFHLGENIKRFMKLMAKNVRISCIHKGRTL